MRAFAWSLILPVLLLSAGCKKGEPTPTAQELTLYTSVDQPVAAPIIQEFERQTGIKVHLVTDTESTKSAGLAARLLAEKANPQADLFWGNEVFHTINLANNGVLATYESPEARTIPDRFKDPQHRWAGTCLRARVIAVSGVVPGKDRPRWAEHVETLTDPELAGRVAIARPTAGTTGGHVAALYVAWGNARADDFFRKLHANHADVLGGNSVVAEEVGKGRLLAGLTDNDDVENVRKSPDLSISMFLPDQGENELGTLTIPCTVGLVAGAPHADPAKRLVDYLLSADVERRLISEGFGRYSVRSASGAADAVRTMNVTYAQIAEALPWATVRADRLLRGEAP